MLVFTLNKRQANCVVDLAQLNIVKSLVLVPIEALINHDSVSEVQHAHICVESTEEGLPINIDCQQSRIDIIRLNLFGATFERSLVQEHDLLQFIQRELPETH